MKHLLLSLMALFMAGTAMADSYFYMDDVAVSLGQQEITLPVKAHFNGRVSAFQLDFTFPQCMTAASIDKGSDLTISYQESDGTTETQRATFMLNETKTRCMAAFMDAGYYDPDGDGNYEQYGVIKWEAGEYEEMMLITLAIEDGFQGGEILLETQVASGNDTRGGTVNDLGEVDVVFSRVCNVIVLEQEQTAPDHCCNTANNPSHFAFGDPITLIRVLFLGSCLDFDVFLQFGIVKIHLFFHVLDLVDNVFHNKYLLVVITMRQLLFAHQI